MRILQSLIASLILGLIAPMASAHEFWIEPLAYQLQPGDEIKAELVVGQEFNGSNYPYRESQFDRFELWQNGQKVDVVGRMGDRPALNMKTAAEGLVVVVHETTDSLLTYTNFEKFQAFADHKDFKEIGARHDERGLSRDRFVESYRRYAKSLVAVGDGAGSDQEVGLKTEIVALANPYTTSDSEVAFKVLWEGAPRQDAQVELFEMAPDGTVEITLHRTDADGVATLPLKPGHSYLVDAVLLEALENDDATKGPVWKSHWASLTFRMPG